MIVRHKIAGNYVNPLNPEKIYLEINHDQQSVINQPRPHVGISNLELRREDVKIINDFILQYGITEGIPYDIEITERGQTEIINMYADLMNGGFLRSKDGLNFGIKMVQSLDSLNDRMDSFTFESLYNETGITPFYIDGIKFTSYQKFIDDRTVYIPYVISTIPNWHDAFLALFGITYIGTELYKVLKQLAQWASPSAGIGAVVHVAQIILEVAFALLLIATLISLITQLIACLIQPLKYHGAMLMTDMLKLVSAKLGLQEQSSIWGNYPYNQIAYLPEKYNPIETTGNLFALMGFNVNGFGSKGYTSPGYAPTSTHNSQTSGIQHGYFNGVGGDFLRLIKQFCNGKFIIQDQTNILQLERRDYSPSNTPFQLQDIRQDWSQFNTDELSASMKIEFINDNNEQNVANGRYVGTVLEATHQQITTINQNLVCLKGLREINIPCARGAAKDKLTFIEQAVQDLNLLWDAFVVLADIGIVAINILIGVANLIIVTINVLIAIWNTIIDVLHAITTIINTIIDAIDVLPGVNISDITVFDNGKGKIGYIGFIKPISLITPPHFNFSDRIDALLLENDIVDTAKLLLVDTQRSEFQGGKRIAYLHKDNSKIINAKHLEDYFYCIDNFCDTPDLMNGGKPVNNRFTKIAPALNNPGEKNVTTLSLANFKNLVSNHQFQDNFGENVIADSIQWYPDNGMADFMYRKAGWLNDSQNPIGAKRAQEIAINLNLKISLPNGQ